jgi:sarcosine oxidase subunit gamma
LGSVGGFEIDIPINRCVASSEQVSARLGPDEWLLIAPASEGPDLERKVAGALGEVFCSVVDISHRNLAISVEGSRSRDVINSGCPLDLSDVAFPEGNATRTILGKAEIVLLRPAGQRAYRVECWRSFMPYVADFLRQGAREFAPHQSDRRQ